MAKLSIMSLLVLLTVSSARGQAPLPEIIDAIRPFVAAVTAEDDTVIVIAGDSTRYRSNGSGAFLALSESDMYIITNEHVVAIKDSLYKTIRYAENIHVSVNVKSIGAISFPAKIRKVSEELDLVALRMFFPKALKDSLQVAGMAPDLWESENTIREGETVLYSGYPLMLGRGHINFPLTRTGIISQVIPGQNEFLIDAFVQPGYSGSPVFLIRSIPNVIPKKWVVKFVGIASSYPAHIIPVLRKVQYLRIPNVGVAENPGFAEVIGVSAIKKLLEIQ